MNCKRCGCYIGEYSGRGRPPCYCKSCAYITHLEKMRVANDKFRVKKELGTTDFLSTAVKNGNGDINFKKEVSVIRKELRKLGLRK